MAGETAEKVREVGPYSRPNSLRRLDHRTGIGRYIRAFERSLVDHVGGSPSFPVRALIDQAVALELQLALLERDGISTDHDRRCFAAWTNAKRLVMREIGLRPVPARPKSLGDYLAERGGKAPADTAA